MNISYLIDKKIKEHRFEIEGCLLEIDKLKDNLQKNPNMEKSELGDLFQKKLIIKDKLLFHKAAELALDDLKKELEKNVPETN